MEILWSVVVLGGLGAAFGFVLAFASKKLEIKKDDREEQLLALLPGANCGRCGLPGCAKFAEEVAAGRKELGACPAVRGERLKAAEKVLILDLKNN